MNLTSLSRDFCSKCGGEIRPREPAVIDRDGLSAHMYCAILDLVGKVQTKATIALVFAIAAWITVGLIRMGVIK